MMVDFAFLDSGTGGIPYMLYLKKKYPECTCVYLGDTKNFPYGEKTSEEVTECAAGAVKKIISNFNPKTIVVACNTISVTALEELRKLFPNVPFVGTVPAIKYAAKVTKNKNIGLLATNATVNNAYTSKLINDFASDCNVYSRGDAELVSYIEHNLFTWKKEERLKAVRPAVDFFASKNCDTIILGCTHFIHVANDIAEEAGKNVSVVDSREGVINQAFKIESHVKKTFEDKAETVKDMTLFVTGFKSYSDEKVYETLCKNFNIPWGGEVKIPPCIFTSL